MSFAISYLLNESYNTEEVQSQRVSFLGIYAKIIKTLLGGNLVSAVDFGTYTCKKYKSGAICQGVPVLDDNDLEACNALCTEPCIPTTPDNVAGCEIGTCFSPVEGTCAYQSPKENCLNLGHEWYDDDNGNIQQCQQGCCVLGDNTELITNQQCQRQSDLLGLEKDFRAEIKTDIGCFALSKLKEEGACVFPAVLGEKKDCKFVTKETCQRLSGDFASGFLCSSPELNTKCESQITTGCVDGKDEVYWIDSCGNQENIYSSSKIQSWNDGKILLKSESCELSGLSDKLLNQDTCGNCNYIAGSICGLKSSEDKEPLVGDYVCKDLRCIDNKGEQRENGESWCEYQSGIGVDESNNRAVDTPGARHFRAVCFDGKIREEPCQDYRNEICVEAQTPKDSGGTFSTAACRLNRWQQCLEYNTNEDKEKGIELCGENPDCFVKKVNIADNFHFDLCAPKYPEGFNLKSNGEGAEQICSFASQKCTITYVKKMSGGWKCVSNCDCDTGKFTQQMNDLCMSLGDCGESVNYLGQDGSSGGYKVVNAPKLAGTYLDTLKGYGDYENSPNEYAEPGDLGKYFGSLGIPNDLGTAEDPEDVAAGLAGMAQIAGFGGTALSLAAGTTWGAGVLSSIGLASISASAGGGAVGASTASIPAAPALSALGGALAGAAIGFAVTSMLIQYTGIGPGLDPWMTYSLIAAGTVAVAVMGYSLIELGPLCAIPGACIAAVVVVVIIVVLMLLGIGDTKKKVVSFSCNPWEPEYGGTQCGLCGSDGKPCSVYSCQSLGQTCEFINQGTENALCVDISPNDVVAPVIKVGEEPGFTYEKESSGVRIVSGENQGCIKADQPIYLNLNLNEPAQCRYDIEHTDKFEDMAYDFGGRSVFLYNHTQPFMVPNPGALLPGYDPERKEDFNLYVRCKDRNGNENTNEYTLNFCVIPGEDKTPAIVTHRIPELETVKAGTEKMNATIYTSEPAECKIDKQDKSYDSMAEQMVCENDWEDSYAWGWKCSSEITLQGTTEENYYIRCLDQPWQNETEKRNVNTQGYEFKIKKSTELQIVSATPNGETLSFGFEPATVEINVGTAGGLNGNAECSYSFDDIHYTTFRYTLQSAHRQVFDEFTSGKKVINIKCVDLVGNTAEKKIDFIVKIDSRAPKVTRVYNSGALTVITDENAECRFVLDSEKCGFDFESGELMSGSGLEHSTEAGLGTYYIKCKDEFGNAPGTCSIVVSG